jgi:cyclin C
MAADFLLSSHNVRWLLGEFSSVPVPLRPVAPNTPLTLPSPSTPHSPPVSPSVSLDLPLFLHPIEFSLVKFYFADLQFRLGRALNLRQPIIATAQIFFKRFYFDQFLNDFEPTLVALTALFMSGKVEECPIPVKSLLFSYQTLMEAEDHEYPLYRCQYTSDDIILMEYYLLQGLTFDLLVFHPYEHLNLVYDKAAEGKLPIEAFQTAWAIINDSFYTDIPCCCAPNLIAIAALCK